MIFYSPDGIVFEVDKKNIHVDERLKKGDVVTFTYDSIARQSTPVNPKIVRVRTDVSWRELVLEHASGRDSVKQSSSLSSANIQKNVENDKVVAPALNSTYKSNNLILFLHNSNYI